MFNVKSALSEEGFEIIKKIGEGGYAKVYSVTWNKYPGKVFAAKIISQANPNVVASYFDELNVLKQLDHKNIIHIYHNFARGDNMILIMEYCNNGSLADHIISNGTMAEYQFRPIAQQCLEALRECHNRSISHHDLKPNNIMINADGRVILCDFGIAEQNDRGKTDSFKGSLIYAPPELILMHPYDPQKADIWSLGVTFYFMVVGDIPWKCANKSELEFQIKFGTICYPEFVKEPIKKLLSSMLRKEPSARLSCSDLLNSEFFKSSVKVPRWKRTNRILTKSKTPTVFSVGTFTKVFTCQVAPTFSCGPTELHTLNADSYT